MVDSAIPSENGQTKSPPAIAQTAAGDYQRDATIVSRVSTAGVLAVVIGKSLKMPSEQPATRFIATRC